MDALTLHWVFAWAACIGGTLLVTSAAVSVARRWLDGRRKDRERAARVAARARETEALERLYAAESAGGTS
jgi:hypothetical protein